MTWGPDMRARTEPARPDVKQRFDADDTATARAAAYFGTGPAPEVARDEPRRDVPNPRREDKRRGRAYTDDLDEDL